MQEVNPAWLIILSAVLVLVACGAPDSPDTPIAEENAIAEPVDVATRVARADPDRGRTQFILCQSCHTLNEGGPNRVGPNLYGMFGSEAGFAPGFNYSQALLESGVTWDAESLDRFLEGPSRHIPGNTMQFVGIPDAENRARLIAYLKRETGAGDED